MWSQITTNRNTEITAVTFPSSRGRAMRVVEMADGSSYAYDAAHRLTDVTEAVANTLQMERDVGGGESRGAPSWVLTEQQGRNPQ
jgi:hypothetical protein